MDDKIELNLESGYIQVKDRKVKLTVRNMVWNPGTWSTRIGVILAWLKYNRDKTWKEWLDTPIKYEIEDEQHIEVKPKDDKLPYQKDYYL